MAKISTGIKILIIVLAFLLVLVAGAVLVYKLQLFPSLNQRVHQFLGLNVVQEEDLLKLQQEELLREQTSIGSLFPHLIPVSEAEVTSIRQLQEGISGDGVSKAEGYNVAFFPTSQEADSQTGNQTGFQPEAVTSAPLWTYFNQYPVVAPSADFYDRVVFIDATPSLVVLDKKTGAELARIPCQVYPGQEAFSHLHSYYFRSKTGNWYEVRFTEGLTPPESLAVVQQVKERGNVDEDIYNSLLPKKDAMDFINAKMNGLLSVSPAVSVPQSILYSVEGEAFAFNRSLVSPAFVFSPAEQGTYTLGLCDEDGSWIRDNAFVVLYTMAGEALAISLDYVADRPQITTHLSNQELYVACVGFFPDSLLLDAAPSQDFRDAASADVEGGEMELEMVELVLEASESAEVSEGEAESAEMSADEASVTEALEAGAEDEALVSEVPETQIQRAWFQVKVAP